VSCAACNRQGAVTVQLGIGVGGVLHRLTAARLPALVAAALAVLAGLAWGWAGSPPATGSPVPPWAIPRLTVLASRAAKANSDASPEWMTAVLTTHAKALTSATPGDIVPGADGSAFTW
jgi:hypothetical protein